MTHDRVAGLGGSGGRGGGGGGGGTNSPGKLRIFESLKADSKIFKAYLMIFKDHRPIRRRIFKDYPCLECICPNSRYFKPFEASWGPCYIESLAPFLFGSIPSPWDLTL